MWAVVTQEKYADWKQTRVQAVRIGFKVYSEVASSIPNQSCDVCGPDQAFDLVKNNQ